MSRRHEDTDEELVEVYLEDSKITKRFCGLTAPIKQVVLELGIVMFDHVKQNAHDTNVKEWKERIIQMKADHAREREGLQQRLDDSEDKYSAFTQQSQKRTELAISTVEGAIKKQYLAEIDSHRSAAAAAERRYTALLEKHEALHTQLDSTFALRMAEQMGTHVARITELEDRLERHRKEYDDRISALTLRAENSTIKGQDGEVFMQTQLNMMFPKWEIEDTHSLPGRGDFILKHGDSCVMIENKNYSKNVQKSEVDKFYRDLDNAANNDIQCALMVSLTTGICCKDDFEFEMRNGKPIMFLHKVRDNMSCVALAMKFLELVVKQGDSLNLKDAEVLSGFKNLASTIKRNFTKQRARLDKFHAEQLEALAAQETSVTSLYGLVGSKY